jgi:hypothetical protein
VYRGDVIDKKKLYSSVEPTLKTDRKCIKLKKSCFELNAIPKRKEKLKNAFEVYRKTISQGNMIG